MIKLTMEEFIFLIRTESYNLPMWSYRLYDDKLYYNDSVTTKNIKKKFRKMNEDEEYL